MGCALSAPPQQFKQQQPQRQSRQSEFQTSTEPIPIISQEQEVNFDGSYKWAYETGIPFRRTKKKTTKKHENEENLVKFQSARH